MQIIWVLYFDCNKNTSCLIVLLSHHLNTICNSTKAFCQPHCSTRFCILCLYQSVPFAASPLHDLHFQFPKHLLICGQQDTVCWKQTITLIHKISFFVTSRKEMCQFLCKLRCWTRKSQWKCFISYGFRVIVSYLYYVISRRLRISLVQSGLLRLPTERRIWRITH